MSFYDERVSNIIKEYNEEKMRASTESAPDVPNNAETTKKTAPNTKRGNTKSNGKLKINGTTNHSRTKKNPPKNPQTNAAKPKPTNGNKKSNGTAKSKPTTNAAKPKLTNGAVHFLKDLRSFRTPIIIALSAVLVLALCFLVFATNIFGLNLFGSSQAEYIIGYSSFPYPPMHDTDENGRLVGLDIDIANAAAEIMGVKFTFVPISWSQREELLVSGEVDMLWGGLERATLDPATVSFTSSYLRADIILLMMPDRDYEQFQDLQGLNVCALNFTPAFDYLKVYDRDVIKSRRTFTPPYYTELRNALISEEFDVMITDINFAEFYKNHTTTEYRCTEPLISSNYAVALRASDTKTLDRLQEALDELSSNGTITTLRTQWIN